MLRDDVVAIEPDEGMRRVLAEACTGVRAIDGSAEAIPLPDDSADLQVLQKDGIGFGLRLDAAGGTVGVDYGLEPGRPPLEGKIHLRLVSTF